MTTDYTKLAATVHAENKAKGFWPKDRNLDEVLMLIISECGEAIEAHRKDKFANLPAYSALAGDEEMFHEEAFLLHIKDTFEDELADVVIRILDLAGFLGCQVECNKSVEIPDNVGAALLGACPSVCDAGVLLRLKKAFPGVDVVTDVAESLADAMSCIFGIATSLNVPLTLFISHKISYNRERPYRHGKKY